MKKLILVFLISYNVSISQSAWNWFYSTPTTNNYTCVKFIDNNTGFITGESGTLLRTTNGGTNWIFIENNTNYLYPSIFPVNSTIIYSLTSNPTSPDYGSNLYKSTNAGINWQMKKHFTNILRTVYFFNENTGYISGDDGVILYTTSGGTNWVDRSPGISAPLQNIQFLNTQTGYISSISNTGIFFKTTNGGLNWNSAYINSNSYYTSFYFKDANTGIVCGGSIIYIPPPPFPGHNVYQEKVFKTTNGGQSWDSTYFGTSGIFRTLCTFNNNVFVFGEGTSRKSTDFGLTWTNLGYAINPTPRYSCLVDTSEGYVIGDYGKIVKIINSWIGANQNQSLTSLPINSIYFINSNTGYILSSDPYRSQGAHIYKTTNSGYNWYQVYYLYNGYMTKNIMFNSNNCGVANGIRELVLTSNGGTSWIYKWYPTTLDINASCILSNNRAIAVGDSGLIVQSFNFGNWSSYQINNMGNFTDITFPNVNTGFILTNNNKILKSTNSGDTWSSQTLSVNSLNCFYFINENTGFIGDNNHKILKTTNSGINWFTLIIHPGIIFYKLYFIDSLRGFTYNYSNPTFHYTIDGGLSWNPITLHSNKISMCMNFANSSTGFIGGDYGTIFRTTNGGTIWVNNVENKIPSSFSLSQNYPNPFNPSTNIKYQIKNNILVTLKVYDILGKEVATLVNEKQSPGEYETQFPNNSITGNQLPSGVYFYSLFADGNLIETKKMVLIK